MRLRLSLVFAVLAAGAVGAYVTLSAGSAVGTPAPVVNNNVLVKARRFRELGAGSAKEIPLIDPLETAARRLDMPTQPGLLDQEETEATSQDRS